MRRNFKSSHRSQKISHSGLTGQRRTKLMQLIPLALPFSTVKPNYIEGADLAEALVLCQNEKVSGNAGGYQEGTDADP